MCILVHDSLCTQTKETLTLKASKFGSKCELPDKFLKKVLDSGVADRVLSYATFKQSKELKKSDGSKRTRITGAHPCSSLMLRLAPGKQVHGAAHHGSMHPDAASALMASSVSSDSTAGQALSPHSLHAEVTLRRGDQAAGRQRCRHQAERGVHPDPDGGRLGQGAGHRWPQCGGA